LSKTLAIFGGNKAISSSLKKYNSIGDDEIDAVVGVLKTGVLSQFIGAWDKDFFGGPKVQEFERACEDYFQVKHAVTVNSWTSGLVCAVGAVGIEPGDEIIVTPWTMCASATAILHWNAIPVFADIERKTFNLDPASIEKNISPYTKAIMAVDIFGHSSNMEEILCLAKKYNLKVISDSAQSPGAKVGYKYAGTIADIGGISLNYHKHIHTGDGGVIFTNDAEMCEKLQLIRNHAEAVVEDKGVTNIANMLGHNFRMGEIEAAIGLSQLKKLKSILASRIKAANLIIDGLSGLEGLELPFTKVDYTHSFYILPLVLDIDQLRISRNLIANALKAEGITGLIEGYQNVHLLPMYQKKIAYGTNGFPWNSDICKRPIEYTKGICPVAEELHDKSFLGFEMCLHELTHEDVLLIINAFRKVWSNLDELRAKQVEENNITWDAV